MVELRKDTKMNFLEAQREFMEKNGIDENNGKILAETMFKTGKEGNLESTPKNRKISLDWNSRDEVRENELWICHVSMRTNYLGYAKPLRKISVSDIIGMSDRMQDIADFLWANGRDEIMKYINPRIESEIQPALEQRISELEAEYSKKAAEIAEREVSLSRRENSLASEKEENLRESRNQLREEYSQKIAELEMQKERFKTETEKLAKDKSTMMSYYEALNADLKSRISDLMRLKNSTTRNVGDRDNNDLIAKYKLENHKLKEELDVMQERMNARRSFPEGILHGSNRGNIIRSASKGIRITDTEFDCPFMGEGRYSVKINADRTRVRFVPDIAGTAICRDGIISVPEFGRINALGNRTGEMSWKMVDNDTLEVSI